MAKGVRSTKTTNQTTDAPETGETPPAQQAAAAEAEQEAESAIPHPTAERTGERDRLPLSGIRVIDVGNFLAGPYAASILGEFGAEVLKVEHPIGGDPMRRFGTPTTRHDATLAWLSEARNRKSVTIDLRQPEGVNLFLKLVAKSDILIENFRPGTMEEWGLSWPILREVNPGLVMLRVSGYGQTAPTAAVPALPTLPMPLAASRIWPASPVKRRCCRAPRRSATILPVCLALSVF